MISINNIHKRFNRVKALDDIHMDIGDKGIYAILGPNGSGKTTLIKCILGMVIPDSGSITVNNSDVYRQWLYRDDIAYMPQSAQFPPNLKVVELIKMMNSFRDGSRRVNELMERFELPSSRNKKINHLSGGTKQRVNIILTFMVNAPIIILDEPTSGLDPVALVRLKELIQEEKSKGKLILVTSHSLSFVNEIADEILFLLDGSVHFRGTIDSLKDQTGMSNLENAIVQLLSDPHV